MDLKEIKNKEDKIGLFMTKYGILMPLWYGLEHVNVEYTQFIRCCVLWAVCSIEVAWIFMGWIIWLPVMIVCTIQLTYYEWMFNKEYIKQGVL